jgi:hypothetical protein
MADTLQPKGKVAGLWAANSHRYYPIAHPADSRQLRGADMYLITELGNSYTAILALARRENASVRNGGQRRRSSRTPSCNDSDMVKVRQVWRKEHLSEDFGSTLVTRASALRRGFPQTLVCASTSG